MNQKNGDPKPRATSTTWGYSMGGPVGKPGGNNKLFFFYSHEYRPTEPADQQRQPDSVPRADPAERNGDFSQSLDNNGTCSAAD